jgi:hypothetical protein
MCVWTCAGILAAADADVMCLYYEDQPGHGVASFIISQDLQ